jgi:hypothetical protein
MSKLKLQNVNSLANSSLGKHALNFHAIANKFMKFVTNMDQDQKAIYLDYPFQKAIVAQL